MAAIFNRIKIVPTRHCHLRCPMCYWSVSSRESSDGLSPQDCKLILDDAEGFDEVHLFSGEFPGYFDRYINPVISGMNDRNFVAFTTTCSGQFLSDSDVEAMCEQFDGVVRFRLSIEGPWGHNNFSADAKHGDTLGRFLMLRDRLKRVELRCTWTHSPSENNDKMLAIFRRRCLANDVPLTEAVASDLTSEKPTWGAKINPWQVGLSSEEVDCDRFTNCAYPCQKYEQVVRQVQVDWDGEYYLCKCKSNFFHLGRAGELGGETLLQRLHNFNESIAPLSRIFEERGILGVASELLNIIPEDVNRVLDADHPLNCGGCNICQRLEPMFPLVLRRQREETC